MRVGVLMSRACTADIRGLEGEEDSGKVLCNTQFSGF